MERYNITDLLRIGLRRFFWVFIPFTIILTVCLVGLGLLPARYHSKALLIVEDQQISPDLVPSAIRARAEDRLQTIKASLRSRENIIELSDRFDLIDRNSDVPFSKRVEAVKEDILISISRVSNTRRSRRGDEPTTITFEIGFVHEDRQTAFRVANQLVTDFLSQNVEARIEVAEDTAAFMRDEERDLRRQIDQVQTQIAEVRRQNPGMAPETIAFNQDTIRRLTEDIEDFEARIEARNQELDLLRAQQPLIIDASSRNDTEKRRQYTAFSRRYTDQHPDMVMLLDELLALEERLEPEAFLDRASKTVDQLSTRLASGNLRPGESRELRLMRNDLEARIVKVQAVGGEQSLPELTFRTRESSMLTQIAGYRDRLVTLREDLAEAEARLEQAPTVQAQLSTLENEEERLQRQLGTTQTARARAERTESLEEQQKAERVLILDPPVLPDVPTSPDKPRVALLLTAAAGGFAAFLGIAPVFVSPRIDSRRQLSQVVPGLTVIEVPEIVDDEERKFRRNVMVGLVILSGFLTLVLAAVAYVVLIR